jgi:NADH-quinone oxidoreductase subunit J
MNVDISYIVWGIAIISAIYVVHAKDVFHSGLWLALFFIAIAGIFVLLEAEFLAVIQILIYAGAVTVIVLFAIMLTKREKGKDVLGINLNVLKLVSFVIFALTLVGVIISSSFRWVEVGVYGSTYDIATILFERYILHFEMIALLLLVALISAVYLARRDSGES